MRTGSLDETSARDPISACVLCYYQRMPSVHVKHGMPVKCGHPSSVEVVQYGASPLFTAVKQLVVAQQEWGMRPMSSLSVSSLDLVGCGFRRLTHTLYVLFFHPNVGS